jgi:hypothetical protein
MQTRSGFVSFTHSIRPHSSFRITTLKVRSLQIRRSIVTTNANYILTVSLEGSRRTQKKRGADFDAMIMHSVITFRKTNLKLLFLLSGFELNRWLTTVLKSIKRASFRRSPFFSCLHRNFISVPSTHRE